MEFGVPSKRVTKVEKYPNTPVITLLPYEGKGTSRKIVFNTKAYDVLGFNDDDVNYVAFSFNRSDLTDNSIINAQDLESDASLKVSKNGTVSNKSHYREIKARYNTDLDDELELALIDSGREFGDQKVFSLVTLKSLNEASNIEVEDEVIGQHDENEFTGQTSDVQTEEEYV